jgi:hypothetical protein
MRVVIVFRDTTYITIILYSWYLVICEYFWLYVWNNWSWVIHTMSTWFWHKNGYDRNPVYYDFVCLRTKYLMTSLCVQNFSFELPKSEDVFIWDSSCRHASVVSCQNRQCFSFILLIHFEQNNAYAYLIANPLWLRNISNLRNTSHEQSIDTHVR